MIMDSVLIIDEVHPLLTNGLLELGIRVDYRPDIKRAEILEIISEYSGLVVRSKTPVDHQVMQKSVSLKWIARAGSGIENIDTQYATAHGIEIFSAAEGNAEAVGEMAIGMLLAMLRNIPKANLEVKSRIWLREQNRGVELNQLTVGIWGYGHTGSAFARTLEGFRCKILAYDKYKSGYGNSKVIECNAEQLLIEADVISFHIPLTSETKGLINWDMIGGFPKPKYLLNLSRGEIAVTRDVLKGLELGSIKGCALDVLEVEDFGRLNDQLETVYSKLMAREDVVLSPHIAGWTHASFQKISAVLFNKIKGFYHVT